MLQGLFFSLYSLAWGLAKPFLKKHKRLQDGYAERLTGGNWQALAREKPVTLWIQAASGGEAYLALELLKYVPSLKNNGENLHILCTSMTKQGMEVLQRGREAFMENWQKKTPQKPCPQISLCYFPFDGPKTMRRAFSSARPKACILLETELWPNFMRMCGEFGAKLYVVNGRMTEKTFSAYKKIKAVFGGINPRAVYATREKDREFFARIFPQSACRFMHNMKFDSVARELEFAMAEKKSNSLKEFFDPKTCVYLFASVRGEEEKDLVPLIAKLHGQKSKSALCVVPRHTARFSEWKKQLEAKGLAVSFVTELMDAQRKIGAGDIVVWNRFGDLKELYAAADYAFVGGSLAPLGGQNFLEPLVYGVIPHTGINLQNFMWVFETQGKQKNLAEENLLCLYASARSLEDTFCGLPEQKFAKHAEIQKRFKTWLGPLCGSSRKVMEEIWADINK